LFIKHDDNINLFINNFSFYNKKIRIIISLYNTNSYKSSLLLKECRELRMPVLTGCLTIQFQGKNI